MPHQCVRCGTLYPDGDKVILQGCTSCKAKLFFYIRKEKLEAQKKQTLPTLTKEERSQIEHDVYDIIGEENEMPVVLDVESIRVIEPGKYELDLVQLFKGDPIVFKVEDGKYIIDLPETFRRLGSS